MKLRVILWLMIFTWTVLDAMAEITIVLPQKASELENLAALELRRFIYLRTGTAVPIPTEDMPETGDIIVIAQKDHSIVKKVCDDTTKAAVEALENEQYIAKTIRDKDGRKILVITGGDAVGALYGTYRVCEKLGVRFYLHGDVIPEKKIPLAVPDVDETGKPLFSIRGINPFHDFPEGPDWWNRDDYMSCVSQLAKMRMNFIGLHCYPEGGVGPESGVWIGLKKDVEAKGKVASAYPSSWANTAKDGMWGYKAMKTSEFSGGADMLFESDDYGPEVMAGLMPKPAITAQSALLFERTGNMFKTAFAYARKLGVKTCIGTETPLTVPREVKALLVKEGKDPSSQAVVRELYEGMFTRIVKLYPVDYYWLWTPEGWTWGGNKAEDFDKTVKDVQSALEALATLGNPFTLATCGWVLGPQNDRAALDKILPKAVPMSCINREVGHAAVEPGFANVVGRPKWAIPWMENDPNLIAPQPWVGRMRHDAVDALRYGCTGLLGIHWRTKVLAQNVSALAAASWDQSWVPAGFDKTPVPPSSNATGLAVNGDTAHFTDPVEGTEDDALYQSVRYNMDAYKFEIPNGTYGVTLKFNEPHYGEPGKRVFGVKIQGSRVIDKLDLFEKAGKNKALDLNYPEIMVTNGLLVIDFPKVVEFPCIAGIVIEGKTVAANQVASESYARKINCGGKSYRDYEADENTSGAADSRHDRAMPVEDFYIDYARASFGESVAEAAGKLLAGIDGKKHVEPSTWIDGPGGIKPNNTPWSQEKARFAFVDELAGLRQKVTGAANLERFDYWLNTYRCMAVMAEIGCMRGELDKAVQGINAEKDDAKKKELAAVALQVRIEMARKWEKMMSLQVASFDTPGELGTIDNLERHNRMTLRFLSKYDAILEKALGDRMPADAVPGKIYDGPARIIVPTVRTHIAEGEGINIRIILLDKQPTNGAVLFYRVMGKGEYVKFDVNHLGRAVYEAKLLPALEDFEYYIETEKADGGKLVWPVTAPAIGQTVVVSGSIPGQK